MYDMKLKTYKYMLLLAVALTALVSCTDILEKPKGSEVTIETIFSNRLYAESYLAEVYYSLVPRGFPYATNNPTATPDHAEFARSILASISDECTNTRGATWGWYVNNAGFDSQSSSKNQEDGFSYHWIGIREAYIFINNIDRVPDSEIPAAEREQMKAEAMTLIAVRYQEMLKRYGGVPIVRDEFDGSSTTLVVPRSSVADVIDFIVELCDEAAKILPDTYDSSKCGRVTKGVALACKSRTLLFAASPFFNSTAAEMVMPYDHPELVCYGDKDNERWKTAAEAAWDVLKWAPTAGVSLIQASDIEGGEIDPKHNAYGYATSIQDNREVLLANKGYKSGDKGFSDGIFYKLSRGMSVMQNFVEYFRKADGSDQNWPEVINERRPFSEYTELVNQMEPRFYQCCWPVGQSVPNFSQSGIYSAWPFSSIDDAMGSSDMFGACPMIKFHYNYNSELMRNWIVFRLAEFYLNYAEAVNEYYGPTGKAQDATMTAVDAVNVIRRRGGLPELNSTQYASREVFREEIRRERAIELFAEGHRNFDCRRWKIADEKFGSTLTTLRYVQNSQKNGYDYYYLAYHQERAWRTAMYLYPFPQSEVDKGYLIQNPGY